MATGAAIADVIRRMGDLLAPLEAAGDPRAYFLATYLRMTRAVAKGIEAGQFADPAWTERWDVVFAGRYLDAIERWSSTGTAPGPWAVAFEAGEGGERIPPVRHVLLGINAHINYDLPQALVMVITDEEFDDAALLDRRRADHERIDEILASRVRAEDIELRRVEQPGDRTLLDRMLVAFNRRATRKFLAEARAKVWQNALILSRSRRDGTYDDRLAELEVLAVQRVTDLSAPGQVILRLARYGFGVSLSDAGVTRS
jgi:hypothetical protein